MQCIYIVEYTHIYMHMYIYVHIYSTFSGTSCVSWNVAPANKVNGGSVLCRQFLWGVTKNKKFLTERTYEGSILHEKVTVLRPSPKSYNFL